VRKDFGFLNKSGVGDGGVNTISGTADYTFEHLQQEAKFAIVG
jgi:hypothetical protein